MAIKTKYVGIFKTKKCGFFFYITIRNKKYRQSGYKTIELAVRDKEMFAEVKEYLKRKRRCGKSLSLGILVSDCDKYLLENFSFHIDSKGYPTTEIRKENKRVYHKYLHKLILTKPDSVVDHKNRNLLDNRRENLRYCTTSQNSQNSKLPANNTSGYKGVYFDKRGYKRPWSARIKQKGKTINLGVYETKEEAIKARQEKAKELFGEFYNG